VTFLAAVLLLALVAGSANRQIAAKNTAITGIICFIFVTSDVWLMVGVILPLLL
jgi:hypothetical protein